MAARNKLFCALLLAILAWGFYDVLTNYESNSCSMTYMFEYPTYLDVPGIPDNVKQAYPRYLLKLYAEGRYAQEARKMKLRGIPVLFIPGNAGSYKQVRSLGSVALRKAERYSFHFNYFSVDFSEEFSGLYGGVLQEQTEFVHHCIKHILTLYGSSKHPPSSVLLVGHSMGGLIARALFTQPDFDAHLVHTIVTQATPQQSPLVKIDYSISAFYAKVNKFWQENINSSLMQHVTVLSIGGGHRDIQVRSGLTSLQGLVPKSRGLSVVTTAIPKVWLSTDHQCVVWCKELVLATKRAIFEMVDKQTYEISTDVAHRMTVFRHHFDVHNGKDKASINSNAAVNLDGSKFEIVKDGHLHLSGSYSKSVTYYLFPMEQSYDSFVITSSIPHNRWVLVCTQGDATSCSDALDVSWRGRMIPPLKSGMRKMHLNLSEFPQAKHIVVRVPTGRKVAVTAEMYHIGERHIRYILPGFFAGGEGKTVLESTQPISGFYNISLDALVRPHQAFTAKLVPLACDGQLNDANSTLGLHVPWSKEDYFSVLPADQENIVALKLHSGRPSQDTRLPQLLAYLNPMCQYKLEVHVAFSDMFGQLVRFYVVLLPCFLVINVVLVLSYHLKHIYTSKPLESFVWVQSSYCKPYIVVPPIALFRSLIKWESLDTTFDLRTLEDRHIGFSPLPLVMFIFGYAIVCVMASWLSIKLHIGGKIMGFFRRSNAVSDSVQDAKAEPASKSDSNSSLWTSVCISGILMSLAVGTCGELALIGALTVYYFKVASLRGKKAFHYHFAILVLLILLVLINAPSFLVWFKNLRYGVQLSADPALYSALVVCGTLAVLLNSRYTIPKTRSVARAASIMLYILSILLVLYASDSLYRLSYFISAVFAILAALQVC